mmetsp:Transcript_25910/g.59849  ORF Transcript_25910/g.59849 Transcript_25910/m.59849 type:complete len:673 (-) Transcript_25910:100-2118(-)
MLVSNAQAHQLRGLLSDGLRDVEAAAARCEEVEAQIRDLKGSLAAKAIALQTCLAAMTSEALLATSNSSLPGAAHEIAEVLAATSTALPAAQVPKESDEGWVHVGDAHKEEAPAINSMESSPMQQVAETESPEDVDEREDRSESMEIPASNEDAVTAASDSSDAAKGDEPPNMQEVHAAQDLKVDGEAEQAEVPQSESQTNGSASTNASAPVLEADSGDSHDAVECRGAVYWQPIPLMLEVQQPIGLPNRGNDCFWLAPLQCLRHAPGFSAVLSAALRPPEQPAQSITQALARILSVMSGEAPGSTATSQIELNAPALQEFRLHAMTDMAGQAGALVQFENVSQKQHDAHEFLCQILDCIGNSHDLSSEAEQPMSPRGYEVQPGYLDSLEKELFTARSKQVAACFGNKGRLGNAAALADDQAVSNVLYEYSMVQWAQSTTRMTSRSLSALLEGQRLAQVHCEACGRYAVSGAEPFTVEEIKLTRHSTGWLKRLFFGPPSTPVELTELIRQGSRTLSAEGYRCGNPSCCRVGTSVHTMKYLRLPSLMILHVNRAEPDGSRCSVPLSFPQHLDLGQCEAVAHFGRALDRNLEPCSTSYRLVGAVFHRGSSARFGHYFACVWHDGRWVCIDDKTTKTMAGRGKDSPMELETTGLSSDSRVVLLFYSREDGASRYC